MEPEGRIDCPGPRRTPVTRVIGQRDDIPAPRKLSMHRAFDALQIPDEVVPAEVLGRLVGQAEPLAIDFHVEPTRPVLELDIGRAVRIAEPEVGVRAWPVQR